MKKGKQQMYKSTAARKHKSKTLRERLHYSGHLRKLFRNYEVLGNKAYRGLKSVTTCKRKELKEIRQQIKNFFAKVRFLEYSGWRDLRVVTQIDDKR